MKEPFNPFPVNVPERTVKRWPRPEGYVTGEPVPTVAPETAKLVVSKATALADLVRDGFELFSHALYFSHGEVPIDPIQDYLAEKGGGACIFQLALSGPVFYGLGPLDHVLWVVDRGHSEPLFEFLASVGGVNRDTGYFWRGVGQRIPVRDVLALRNRSVLPPTPLVVEATIFGVSSNRGIALVKPSQGYPNDLAKVVFLPADQETILLGDAVLREKDRPFDAIDPVRSREDA